MILLVDDDEAIRASLSLLLKQGGYFVQTAAHPDEALAKLAQKEPQLVISDMNFSIETSGEEGLAFLKEVKQRYPQLPVILITAWGSVPLAVEGMKLGAADFINKPWQNEHLLQSVKTVLTLARQKKEDEPTGLSRAALNKKYDFDAIVGEDRGFLHVLETVGKVSATDASILIMGESGTGKEMIAEAVHLNSHRYNKAFVKVNLGGISASLFESEMFGHKRGAFTDAKNDRVGRFELANGGTIFLDEIGDLDANSQVKLLRVLQDRTYEVLGDSKTRTVDVRVICATNRNLEEMVAKGQFREDLYYRINLITVKLPALRERPGDIPLLVNYFIRNLREIYQRPELEASREALRWLRDQPLPGNIRELKNVVERAVLLSPHQELQLEDFKALMRSATQPPAAQQPQIKELPLMPLEEMEKAMIMRAMVLHKENMSKVAQSLGLSRGALYRRLEKYNIPYEATH
ncbi:sigma-54 dependent transcriptional regulator [Cesiribacter sp. SM1]|uniref:sigma-54-dependent transcriptional regulator n=1 Tax=Cesiribacter sp. SM1 TaxID=2861196 RepID=UPI001CD20089|nr:sigma-54 dependent transcriptional regulator [Cesiribacter sp. SM1]